MVVRWEVEEGPPTCVYLYVDSAPLYRPCLAFANLITLIGRRQDVAQAERQICQRVPRAKLLVLQTTSDEFWCLENLLSNINFPPTVIIGLLRIGVIIHSIHTMCPPPVQFIHFQIGICTNSPYLERCLDLCDRSIKTELSLRVILLLQIPQALQAPPLTAVNLL